MGFELVFPMQPISQLSVLMLVFPVHNSLVKLFYTGKHGEAIHGSKIWQNLHGEIKNTKVWNTAKSGFQKILFKNKNIYCRVTRYQNFASFSKWVYISIMWRWFLILGDFQQSKNLSLDNQTYFQFRIE